MLNALTVAGLGTLWRGLVIGDRGLQIGRFTPLTSNIECRPVGCIFFFFATKQKWKNAQENSATCKRKKIK